MRGVSQAAFTKRYREWCKRHGYNFSAKKAEGIHRQTREMIALVPESATTKLLIQEARPQLLSLSRMAEVLRTEMNRLAAELPEYPVVMREKEGETRETCGIESADPAPTTETAIPTRA